MYNTYKSIKIIGVGGCGCNGVVYLHAQNLKNVSLIAANTDKKAMDKIKDKDIKGILLGEDITKGKGSNGDVELGYKAAKQSYDEIKNALKGGDIIFIRAGMGGGTGTGASLFIAEVARELGAKKIFGLISMPFSFEGENRIRQATEGLKKLEEKLDDLFVISNDDLIKKQSDQSFQEVMDEADEIFLKLIEEIIYNNGERIVF